MAYTDRLSRFNVTGVINGEIAVNTIWLRNDSGTFGPGGSLETQTNKVRDEWKRLIEGGAGLPVGIAPFIWTGCTYNEVQGYRVDAAGRATEQFQAAFPAGVKGQGADALPLHNALCITLKTNQPGRSGRGRLFMGPLVQSMLVSNGRINLQARDEIAKAFAGFYTRLRDVGAAQDAFRPVIASRTKTDAYKITSVSVGDYVDTMRSRRSALVENRQSEVVDAS
jgi:hypothetical protein